jgi:hypothetical protein
MSRANAHIISTNFAEIAYELPETVYRRWDEIGSPDRAVGLGMDKPEPLRDPPKCIKCGEKMWFSCTELEKPGFVHHVYECKKCRSTQSFVTPK